MDTFQWFLAILGGISSVCTVVTTIALIKNPTKYSKVTFVLLCTSVVIIASLLASIFIPRLSTQQSVSANNSQAPQFTATSTSPHRIETITPTPTNTPIPTDTPTPSPTPPPKPGTVLYAADWSREANGWLEAHGWSALSGMFINSGNQDIVPVFAPYIPDDNSINNYTVEASIRVDGYVDNGTMSQADSFGLLIRATDAQNGYSFASCISSGIYSCGNSTYSREEFLAVLKNNQKQTLQEYQYEPKKGDWHMYKIEVKDNVIDVFIDGSRVLHAMDDTYLKGGEVGLWSNGYQLSVRSFKITAA